jgi:hypothetical protein
MKNAKYLCCGVAVTKKQSAAETRKGIFDTHPRM